MSENNKYGWDYTEDSIAFNYIDVVKSCVSDDALFKNFRQALVKTNILEGWPPGGQLWLDKILSRHGDAVLLEKLELFKRNDVVGTPTILNYGKYGDVCPFTFKYIMNGLDIKEATNNYQFKKIVEVGAGFGSMCIIMDSLYNFDEYVIIDLPDVINLIKKYLSHFPEIYKKLKFISCEDLKSIEKITDIDLFISDSCLAECGWDTQQMYIEKLLKNSTYGFVVYNFLHCFEKFISTVEKMFTEIVIENDGVNFVYLKK